MSTPELLNVDAVAKMLGISKRLVWRLRDRGAMPMPVRLGGQIRGAVRFKRAELEQWIADGCPDLAKQRQAREGRA